MAGCLRRDSFPHLALVNSRHRPALGLLRLQQVRQVLHHLLFRLGFSSPGMGGAGDFMKISGASYDATPPIYDEMSCPLGKEKELVEAFGRPYLWLSWNIKRLQSMETTHQQQLKTTQGEERNGDFKIEYRRKQGDPMSDGQTNIQALYL
ncbi:hypothetical protein ACJ73_10350 [Blastomyces percursus]|uniref:Uncharacterized protein n=1 Tax=Blastomyces percursus TaxID=1658174 RepID=A0A1J9NZ57_9EURO|nr:hypothetical protein ACJ73_10350 [Blastomyces percursus]